MSEKKYAKAASITANTLPILRAGAAPLVAKKLEDTPQDERSWAFASTVAFILATDKADGLLARYAGPTRIGGFLDQLSDKVFFLIPTRQLVKNGEIAPIHYYAPLARDLGVSAVRGAFKDRIQTDARMAGKVKMASQSAALVVACSPLSEWSESQRWYGNRDLMKDLYSVATASSIVSGAEFGLSAAKQLDAFSYLGKKLDGDYLTNFFDYMSELIDRGVIEEAEKIVASAEEQFSRNQ